MCLKKDIVIRVFCLSRYKSYAIISYGLGQDFQFKCWEVVKTAPCSCAWLDHAKQVLWNSADSKTQHSPGPAQDISVASFLMGRRKVVPSTFSTKEEMPCIIARCKCVLNQMLVKQPSLDTTVTMLDNGEYSSCCLSVFITYNLINLELRADNGDS